VFGILAAISLGAAIAAMGVIGVANQVMAKRDLQRVADLAATAGTQLMDGTDCSRATFNATHNATANGFTAGGPRSNTITIACGRWDTSANAAIGGTSPYFTAGSTPGPINAVRVVVTQSVPFFFAGPARPVSAVSTAKVTNTVGFSLGTGVASLNNGLLNQLLGGLVGGNINLDAVSYNGLATTSVKVADLVAQINAGNGNGLLQTKATLRDFILAMAVVVSPMNAIVGSALQTIGLATASGGPDINLVDGINGAAGLLSVDTASGNSALNASINVLNALMTEAQIAQKGKPAIQLTAGLLGLVSLQVAMVSPPTIVAGEAGINPLTGKPRTVAHSSVVQVAVTVSLGVTKSIPLVSQLVTVNLPIYLLVAPATATLDNMSCAATKADSQAQISVQPGVATLCVGDAPAIVSSAAAFSCKLSPTATLASILGIITVTAGLEVQAIRPAAQTLFYNGVIGDSDDTQSTSTPPGGAVSNALSGLSTSLPANLSVRVLGIKLLSVPSALLSVIASGLAPALSGLDTLLVPLLQLLGVQIGYATVQTTSFVCGDSQIVY
jgi:uncharacterized membrane protein